MDIENLKNKSFTILCTLATRDIKFENVSYEEVLVFLKNNRYDLFGWSIGHYNIWSSAEYFLRYKTKIIL